MADKLPDSMVEELRRSFEHVLVPEFASLQDEIKTLHELISRLEKVSMPLPDELNHARKYLENLESQLIVVDKRIGQIQLSLTESENVTELIKIGLRSALQQEVDKAPNIYGRIISPAISKAITDKIKNSRNEMIEALHPIIGQTIQSALAEAFNDLRMRIDTSMNQSLNLGKLINRVTGRVRGISNADQIIRESLAYNISHVFLIHKSSGLLLDQVSLYESKEDLDIISSMLTAIGDFAQDTFGTQESELEEIQFGKAHILIKSGTQAYIASVIEGVQPSGYAALMQSVAYQINQDHDAELNQYDGAITNQTDFKSELMPLLNPSPEALMQNNAPATLSRGQKIGLGFGFLGLILTLFLLAFMCNFSLRLLPLAYPKATQTLLPVVEVKATAMPTVTPTLTQIPTQTSTSLPTEVPTRIPTQISKPILGVVTGNVYSRLEPSAIAKVNPAVVIINTPIEILAVQGKWAKISWKTDFGIQEGWVPLVFVGVPDGLPSHIVTQVP